jgi:hypothetical protein
MSKPLVVTIPHQLGREEANRRLRTGFDKVQSTFGQHVSQIEQTWAGDHLDFKLGVLGQSASGTLDVENDHVRVEVQLPWLLAVLGEKAKSMIEKQGQLMLEKK